MARWAHHGLGNLVIGDQWQLVLPLSPAAKSQSLSPVPWIGARTCLLPPHSWIALLPPWLDWGHASTQLNWSWDNPPAPMSCGWGSVKPVFPVQSQVGGGPHLPPPLPPPPNSWMGSHCVCLGCQIRITGWIWPANWLATAHPALWPKVVEHHWSTQYSVFILIYKLGFVIYHTYVHTHTKYNGIRWSQVVIASENPIDSTKIHHHGLKFFAVEVNNTVMDMTEKLKCSGCTDDFMGFILLFILCPKISSTMCFEPVSCCCCYCWWILCLAQFSA